MKKYTSCAITTILMSSMSFSVQAQDFSQQARDIAIMSGIFQTVLEEDTEQNMSIFSPSTEGLYLADQGALFHFTVSAHGPFNLDTFNLDTFFSPIISGNTELIELDSLSGTYSDFSIVPEEFDPAKMITQVHMIGSIEPVVDINEITQAGQALAEQQSQVQNLQSSLRETQQELAQDSSLSEKIDEISARLQSAMTSLNEKRSELVQLTEEKQAKVATEHNAHAQQMVTSLTNTLCDYGSTLRSLENDEHLSISLNNYSLDNSDIHVMVFDIRDIKNCHSAEELMEKATIYDF